MFDERAHILVHISHDYNGDDGDSTLERRRHEFWGPIIAKFDAREPIRPETYESAIRRELPDRLRYRLRDFFGSRVGDRVAVPIIFTVSYISYGSMDIGINVEPVSKIVDIFDGNFEYFYAFLQSYVPMEIESVILGAASGSYTPAQSRFVQELKYSVSTSSIIKSSFKNEEKIEADARSGNIKSSFFPLSSMEKARWLWIASNTSLIVPTLIASIYIVSISNDLKQREKHNFDSYNDILKEQTKLLGVCGSILSKDVRSPPADVPAKAP